VALLRSTISREFIRGKAGYHSIKDSTRKVEIDRRQRSPKLAISIEQREREYVAHIVDLLQFFGSVESKSMFGGFDVFLEGLMFGLVADNELYLKVDAKNRQDYEDLGLQAFSFGRNGKEFKMIYYQAPQEAMEDAELLSAWASNAYGAAMRAAAKKGGKRK
jgi:DNA transformation protein